MEDLVRAYELVIADLANSVVDESVLFLLLSRKFAIVGED
jgi:hypothetical protein